MKEYENKEATKSLIDGQLDRDIMLIDLRGGRLNMQIVEAEKNLSRLKQELRENNDKLNELMDLKKNRSHEKRKR